MRYVLVSDKGRVTLPAEFRRKLGIKSGSRMKVNVQDGAIVLKVEGNVMEAYGALHEYAKGDAEDCEAIRSGMEKSVSREVTESGNR